MSSTLVKTLRVRFEAEVDDLARGLDDVASRAAVVGERMQSVGRDMTTYVTAPLVGMATAFVAAFAKQEEAEAKLNAVIAATGGVAGVTAEHVKELATQLQRVTTFGDEVTIAGASVLLTFKSIRNELGEGNDVFDRTIKVGQDIAALLGGDLQSAYVMLGKALEDPTIGMTALTRVGVTFSEEQKNVIKALAESGDALGAQKVMLEALETQLGGTAEAMAATVGGSMKQAWNDLGDAAESFGAILAPMVTQAAELIASLARRIQEMDPNTQKWILGIGAVAAAIGPLLVVIGTLLALMPAIVSGLGLVGAAFAILTGPIGLIAAAIVALGIVWMKWGDDIKAVLSAVWGALKSWADAIAAPIKKALVPIQDLARSWIEMWTEIITFFVLLHRKVTETLQEIVRVAFHWLGDRLAPITDRVVGILRPIIEFVEHMNTAIARIVQGLVTAVWDLFVGGMTRVANGVREQIDRVTGFFSGLKDKLVGNSIVVDMVNEIGLEFSRMAEEMTEKTGLAVGLVEEEFHGMETELGESVGRAADDVGRGFGSMVTEADKAVVGMGDIFDAFGIELPESVSSLVGDIKERWDKISSVFQVPMRDSLTQSLKDWKEFAVQMIKLFKNIWDQVGKIVDKLLKAWGGASFMQQGGGAWGGQPGMGVPGTGPVMPMVTSVDVRNLGKLEEADTEKIKLLASIDGRLKDVQGYLARGLTVGSDPSAAPTMSVGAFDAALGSTVIRAGRLVGAMEVAL